MFAFVDAEDRDWLMAEGPWNLYHYRDKQYAKRTRRKGERNQPGVVIYMHRRIAQVHAALPQFKKKSKQHILIDHKNSKGLDNRKSNLVRATPQQNRLNIYGMWWAQSDFINELDRGEHDRYNL